MTAFTHLRFGRRSVRSRILIFHRVSVDAARDLMPADLEPRLVRGSAVAVICYTQLGSLVRALLPHRLASTHHLAYQLAAKREAGPTMWVTRRDTSSLLRESWSEKILHRDHGRARFHMEESSALMKLEVESARGEELYLHAELHPSTEQNGALFARSHAVREFLDSAGDVQPQDPLAPEADVIPARHGFTPQALRLSAFRSAFLSEHGNLDATLDSAWRLVPFRVQRVRVTKSARAERGFSGDELPAL